MSDDLISRQAEIDALHTQFRDGFDGDKWWNSTHVLAVIESLPSVFRWIPVTERLPEKSGNYLVTWKSVKGCTTTVQMMRFYQYLGGFGDAAKYILAWMPLPDPWKGESDATD